MSRSSLNEEELERAYIAFTGREPQPSTYSGGCAGSLMVSRCPACGMPLEKVKGKRSTYRCTNPKCLNLHISPNKKLNKRKRQLRDR